MDFCTPRCVITREFGRDKLRVGWRIRRFEKRIRNSRGQVNKIMLNGKTCTREKEKVSTKRTEGREY